MGEAVLRSPQSTVIYEEPSSSGRMRLDEEGGAVLLTNPDGSTQLVLLTSDQRQQVAAVQSWKLPPPETPTYTVCICPTGACPQPSAVLKLHALKPRLEDLSLEACLARTRLGSVRAWPVPCGELSDIPGCFTLLHLYAVHHMPSERLIPCL